MKRIPRTIIVYLGSLVVMALVTAFKFTSLPPEIPLLYSLPGTSTQVVDVYWIAVIPIISFAFIVINHILARRVFKGDLFVRKVTYIANISIILFFTYIYIKIVFLIS